MDGMRKSCLPIKYAMIPPRYEMVASIKRFIQGPAVFALQAIKISGGSKPRKVSDTMKTESITQVEYLYTSVLSNVSMSMIKNSRTSDATTNKMIICPALIAVSFKKG